MRDIAYWAGLGLASIVFSGFFAVGLGLLFRNDTPENTGEKIADLAEMPAPLPSDFPPFHPQASASERRTRS